MLVVKNENLIILQKNPCDSIDDFISHWRQLYNYGDDTKYSKNIDKNQFTPTDLEELFHWKNGMTLKGSGGKEKSLNEKIINRIEIINQYKTVNSVDLLKFNKDFSNLSAVWRIFLLHIIKPKKFPIYDQHIHRSFNFIHNLEWQSINNTISDKKKLDFYYSIYLPYIENSGLSDLKALDEAFFAFGQFLNTRNQKLLLVK
jgi:hypothetical protein